MALGTVTLLGREVEALLGSGFIEFRVKGAAELQKLSELEDWAFRLIHQKI